MSSNWNQTSPGASWAMQDIPLAMEFPGKYLVAVPNEVIEVGEEEAVVRARAAEKLGLPADEIMVCMIAPMETRVPIGW